MIVHCGVLDLLQSPLKKRKSTAHKTPICFFVHWKGPDFPCSTIAALAAASSWLTVLSPTLWIPHMEIKSFQRNESGMERKVFTLWYTDIGMEYPHVQQEVHLKRLHFSIAMFVYRSVSVSLKNSIYALNMSFSDDHCIFRSKKRVAHII